MASPTFSAREATVLPLGTITPSALADSARWPGTLSSTTLQPSLAPLMPL